jgi:glutamate 5-kinase
MASVSAAAALLAGARRVVVTVGSSLLVDGRSGAADHAWLAGLARDAARLKARGCEVLVVSSGSVALGRRRLGLGRRALSLEEKQAAAAAGQSLLMRAWEEAFESYGAPVAQVLVTRDDTETRRRWLNARATIETLLGLGAAPIVNENDTVATEEIRYGDNDRLAARVAQMIGADLLILLSDIDGLYPADPRRDPHALHVPLLRDITAEIEAMGGGRNEAAGVGSGGMATKLAAARIAHGAGCATLITLGRPPGGASGPLEAVELGAQATVFEPHATPAAAYKQWIAGALAPQGSLTVDAGAAAALRAGKSLLPAGVRAVEGGFGKGDAVVVLDEAGREIARGLAAYGASEARAIRGRRSDAIESILGYAGRPALIHRNDLVLVNG